MLKISTEVKLERLTTENKSLKGQVKHLLATNKSLCNANYDCVNKVIKFQYDSKSHKILVRRIRKLQKELEDTNKELKKLKKVDKMNLQHFEQVIIGSTPEEADNFSKEFFVRVMQRDGENFMGTAEFNPARVNVAVVDGMITEVLSNG